MKFNGSTISDASLNIPVFSDGFLSIFKPAVAQQLLDASKFMDCARGSVLFMHEDIAENFYIVESGWVKIFRETLDGDDVILDVLPAGVVFGEEALFTNGSYPYGAEVVEDARLFSCPLDVLEALVQEDGDTARALLRHMAQRNHIRDKEIEHRTVQSAPQRVGCFLLNLCKKDSKKPVVLHLPYDKTLLAARLGMKPETFSRALSKLQEDVGIKVRGATIELPAIDRLVAYTCTACSNVFPCD